MALSAEQKAAGIANVQAQASAARAIVEGRSWHFWESDAKAQQLGAVRIVEATSLRAMRNLADDDSGDSDEKFLNVAHQAEASLREIQGYSADATFDSVIAATARQTVTDTAHAAGAVVSAAANVAGAGLSALWGAIPLSVKVVGGLALAGAAYFYLRPVLGLLPSRKAEA